MGSQGLIQRLTCCVTAGGHRLQYELLARGDLARVAALSDSGSAKCEGVPCCITHVPSGKVVRPGTRGMSEVDAHTHSAPLCATRGCSACYHSHQVQRWRLGSREQV